MTNQVTTDEAIERTLAALADLPSGPNDEETLAVIQAAAWELGVQAGFDSTSEGFNGECAFDHCAPDNYPPTNPYRK